MDALDRYFRTGKEKDAREAAALGDPAVTRALRELIRSDRSRAWLVEGERAAAFLALVPPRPDVADVAWRMNWDLFPRGNTSLNLAHIVAQAGPSVLRPLHEIILYRSQDLDALGAVEDLAKMWPLYPELRPDILAAWGHALKVRKDSPEVIGHLAYETMELGAGELGLVLLRLVESGAAKDEADPDEIRAWLARGCPASGRERRKMPDFHFVFKRGKRVEDDSAPLQRLLEEWQAAEPDAAVAPDAWLHHRTWYCAHNGELRPETAEDFLLSYLPEQFVAETDEQERRLPDDFERFVAALAKTRALSQTRCRAIRRRMREARSGFERMRHLTRLFCKSKRILLAAREAGIEPLDRAKALAWWHDSGTDVGEAEWQLPADYRLGDAYLAGRVQ